MTTKPEEKNQNKFICARVVTLIFLFVSIYQIFSSNHTSMRCIKLLLISSVINTSALSYGLLYCAYSRYNLEDTMIQLYLSFFIEEEQKFSPVKRNLFIQGNMCSNLFFSNLLLQVS